LLDAFVFLGLSFAVKSQIFGWLAFVARDVLDFRVDEIKPPFV